MKILSTPIISLIVYLQEHSPLFTQLVANLFT
ncbi:hypothetical protein HDF22_003274 [Mucilaginibacter lappiensis]|uniref:Uncharacterized protein n=1 Tax=Mucilaginibacter lappiensis TaxID=354630 RepID=A0A841JDC5_9SPHI|nr:hypothetical protein [Mucilaginibacter lappiensis]MBB6129149.1 hypothetical protein [Mucilaginibacter lappiensis]